MEFNRGAWNQVLFNRLATAIPNKLYLPAPSLPAMEKYPVRIYDSSFNLLADVDDYISLTWTRRMRSAGEFSLLISRYCKDGEGDIVDRDYIQKKYWVSIFRGGVARLARIDQMEITSDDETWKLGGPDAKCLFTDRIALVGVTAGTGFDTQTATAAETANRHFIDGNMISSSDANRNISALELETDGGLGGDVDYSARLEYVHDILESNLTASPDQIGYEAVFDRANKKIRPHFFAGVDRSSGAGKVLFSTALGNMVSPTYTYDASGLRNVGYVGNNGEGASRTFTKVVSGTEATGLDRREIFIDGSDCTTADELTQKGVEVLNEQGETESLIFEVMLDNSFKYMTRSATGAFDLGDTINVIYTGVASMSARIVEITESYGTGEAIEAITVTVGTTPADTLKFQRISEKRNRTRSRS